MLILILFTLSYSSDLISGPQPGSKFGPYAFLIATGPNRGTSHCYVCETGADPAVIVLARSTSEPLGNFLQQLDRDLSKFQDAKLRAWATMVGLNQPSEEPKLAAWSKRFGLRHIPLGIYEDPLGPPGYRLHQDADLTILLVHKNKVLHNLAYRKDGFTALEAKKLLDLIPKIVK